jgi:hypothetical protein
MRFTDEQTAAVKGEVYKAVGSLTAEQILKFGGACFGIGMIFAEAMLNRRAAAIAQRERLAASKAPK